MNSEFWSHLVSHENKCVNKYIFHSNRNYFFDLDDNSKEVEKGQDALELAQQSEASLNNLLDLEDSNEDEALLQWEEKNKAALKASEKSSGQKGGAQGNLDLLGRFDEKDLDQKMLSDLMASPIKDLSEESEDSPSRFSAQWNKLFGQEASNINDNNVPDLKLDTLGQADDDFGSFFSAQTSAALAADGASKDKTSGAGGAILPSQLFDLDQSLFSLQSPKQGNDTTKTNSNSR